jgi:hypothetical protein
MLFIYSTYLLIIKILLPFPSQSVPHWPLDLAPGLLQTQVIFLWAKPSGLPESAFFTVSFL